MGYLDHSTNNIILDAVLTDYGRQQLASANNSFNITYYALGDDEVDYRLVKKYGRAVGKEKIEKNTPIFEAFTNPNIALKYRLIGTDAGSTAALQSIYLPILSSNPSSISLSTSTQSQTIQVSTTWNNSKGSSIPAEFVQKSFQIKLSDRFFYISSATGATLVLPDPSSIDAGDPNRTATYVLKNITSPNFTFEVTAKNIDSTTLTVYGKKTSDSSRIIYSYMSVIGEQFGSTLDVPINYTAKT